MDVSDVKKKVRACKKKRQPTFFFFLEYRGHRSTKSTKTDFLSAFFRKMMRIVYDGGWY